MRFEFVESGSVGICLSRDDVTVDVWLRLWHVVDK